MRRNSVLFNFRQLQKCHDLRLLSWKVLFKGSTMNWSGKRTVFVCVVEQKHRHVDPAGDHSSFSFDLADFTSVIILS